MNEQLREELLHMVAEDARIRDELAEDGSLFTTGYHPKMEAVHVRNARRLKEIIRESGWPGKSLVGKDGSEAVWRIAQHSIGDPDFQRSTLQLLKQSIAEGESPAWQMAMLEDRICVMEGHPQIYGTQFDWDKSGKLAPCEIADPKNVERLREQAGLPPLAEVMNGFAKEPRPQDYKKREADFERWAVAVGWRNK